MRLLPPVLPERLLARPKWLGCQAWSARGSSRGSSHRSSTSSRRVGASYARFASGSTPPAVRGPGWRAASPAVVTLPRRDGAAGRNVPGGTRCRRAAHLAEGSRMYDATMAETITSPATAVTRSRPTSRGRWPRTVPGRGGDPPHPRLRPGDQGDRPQVRRPRLHGVCPNLYHRRHRGGPGRGGRRARRGRGARRPVGGRRRRCTPFLRSPAPTARWAQSATARAAASFVPPPACPSTPRSTATALS